MLKAMKDEMDKDLGGIVQGEEQAQVAQRVAASSCRSSAVFRWRWSCFGVLVFALGSASSLVWSREGFRLGNVVLWLFFGFVGGVRGARCCEEGCHRGVVERHRVQDEALG